MKKKIIISITLVLILTVSISSLVFGAEEEIDILFHTCGYGRVIRDMLPEFEEEYGIKVNYHEVNVGVIHQKVQLEWAAKSGAYDVVNIASLPPMIESGGLLSLDEYIDKADPDWLNLDDFLPTNADLMQYEGSWYGLPVRNDTRLMHINTEMFEEAGLEPEAPETFSEMVTAAKKLTDHSEDQAGMIMGYKGAYPYDWALATFIRGFGGEFFDDNMRPTFDSPQAIEGVELYVDLMREHDVVPEDAMNIDHPAQCSALLNGRGAMNMNVPARWADQFDEDISKVSGEIESFPVPEGPAGRAPLAGAWSLSIMSDSEAPEAAWKFIVWATSTDVQKRAIQAGGDCNPTRYSVIEDPELQEEYSVFKAIQESAGTAKPNPQFGASTQVSDILNKAVRKAAAGEVSVEEAMKNAADNTEQLLDALGYYDE
ncbi:MAG: ABC transporter substrate-binding protein [Halothermotrichaceae bacterium]